ncbi:MAG TPA: HAMP domain-containing sensor histidine kinase [Acidimicrobiia bacterium]
MAATVLVVAGVTARLTRQHLTEALDRRLAAAATSFRDGPAGRVTDPTALSGAARNWLATQPHSRDEVVAVRTAGGEVLATSGGLDLAGVERAAELLAAGEARWWDVDGGDHGIRVLTVPLVLDGRPAGTLLAAASRRGLDETVGHLLSAIAWASAAGIAFATGLAFVAVRRTLRPLQRMVAEIDSIRPTGELPTAVAVDTPADEVGRVADAFDRLLARVDDAFATQRRFVSDASHELRTPLTVARGQLELIGQLDDPDARRSVGLAVEELDRIRAIVEELLLLARLDEGLPLRREPVEVDLVLQEAAMRGLVLGGGTVEAEPAEGLSVLADPDRLLQVISNLVGNALRHGGGVAVTLSARREPGRGDIAINVTDTGPGIAAEDLPHVFDRFYRGAAARSFDPPDPGSGAPGGAGLGLAIVASLVQAMGGAVAVRSGPGVRGVPEAPGTTFTVRLPRAPTPDATPPAPGGAGGAVRSGISGRRGG